MPKETLKIASSYLRKTFCFCFRERTRKEREKRKVPSLNANYCLFLFPSSRSQTLPFLWQSAVCLSRPPMCVKQHVRASAGLPCSETQPTASTSFLSPHRPRPPSLYLTILLITFPPRLSADRKTTLFNDSNSKFSALISHFCLKRFFDVLQIEA